MEQQREHAHAFLDRLPVEQLSAVCDLLGTMLSPLERRLALAPVDDEPLTPEDVAAIEASRESLRQGRSCSMEEVSADFGLTLDDLRKGAGPDPSQG
jgi:DnaJ-domain-containing protein 1